MKKSIPILLIGMLLIPCMIVSSQEEVVVTRVAVWVKATEKGGKPAVGLTEKDFEVFEDGKKMDLNCFEETTMDLKAPVQETQTAPQEPATIESDPTKKRVVFLLDLSNTSQTELLHLKQKTTEFLTDLSKNWLVSLVSLYNGMIEINVPETSDPYVLGEAIERMRANMMRDIDALNNRRQLTSILNLAAGRPEQKMKDISRACALAEEFIQREKAESMMWLESLREFDKYVRKREDQPHTVVLFLSGGISSSPGKQYYETIRSSRVVTEMFQDERDFIMTFGECQYRFDSIINREFEKLVGKLNTNNITFYTINSRGSLNDLLDTVRESDRKFQMSDLDFLKDYQDFLVLIADDTGGTHFENSQNFKRGFDAIVQDLNHQYLLCYEPPEHAKEGYHKIKVKTSRSGVKLRHRDGYYE